MAYQLLVVTYLCSFCNLYAYHVTDACILFLVGHPPLPEPVLPSRMAQIDLTCGEVPLNTIQSIFIKSTSTYSLSMIWFGKLEVSWLSSCSGSLDWNHVHVCGTSNPAKTGPSKFAVFVDLHELQRAFVRHHLNYRINGIYAHAKKNFNF